jgi:hypothetical protein
MTLTDTEKLVELRVTGDPTGSGTPSTAIFQMVAGTPELQLQQSIRTGTIASGSAQLLTTFFNEITGQEDALNEEVVIDVGTGQHTVELSFSAWAGGTDYQGNTLQWGDTGDATTLTKTDATGEHAMRKMQCLFFWLKNSRIDSLPEELGGSLASGGPAELRFGQHTPGGVYDPLDVVLEEPSGSYGGEAPTTFSGNIRCISVADLGSAADAEARTPRGT